MEPLHFLLILPAIAVLLILIGKAKDTDDKLFRQNGIQTQGIIVENKLCWGQITVIRPIVKFTTQQGEVIQAMDENGLALAIPRFIKGQNIVLIYSKANPRNFRIMTSGDFA